MPITDEDTGSGSTNVLVSCRQSALLPEELRAQAPAILSKHGLTETSPTPLPQRPASHLVS